MPKPQQKKPARVAAAVSAPLQLETKASARDTESLLHTQADTVKALFAKYGYDVRKWSKADFDAFVQATAINCLVHAASWGIAQSMADDGCTDDLNDPIPF